MALFRSREHWKMVPDISHAVVTAGYGSGQTLTVTSRTSDGQTIIAYIPTGNATTLTVDMSKIISQSQQASCSWFNPSSGAYTLIGVFGNAGTRNFTPPDSNDWVLVIDDASGVSVQVSPPSATLQQSGTQQFTATVTGTTNPAVTWSIQPQVGTLTPNGQSALYTAPAVITSQQVVTIMATSAADSTKSGSAAITLMPPGAVVPVITSPSTASGTVGSAFSYQITAINNPISYGATGLPTGLSVNTATGLISGTPTAPGTTPVPLSATNAAGTGTATLTVTINSTSSFVQVAAGASPGAAKVFSLSFPANTVAGDLILAAFDFDTTTTPSSVTDSQGNVFAQVGSQLTSPGGVRSRVYYAKKIKGGADTVTVNLSTNSGWIELYLTEYSGVDQVNPVDAQAGASGGAGAVSSGNATTTVAGDVIFGYCVGDRACMAGSGFAARSTFNNNLIEDMLAGNPGSYAAKGSATSGWTMQLVALKLASH